MLNVHMNCKVHSSCNFKCITGTEGHLKVSGSHYTGRRNYAITDKPCVNRATYYVSQNIASCYINIEKCCTTNLQQTEVIELTHQVDGRAISYDVCASSHDVSTVDCGQQAWESTSVLLTNMIDLLSRNFLSPEFGTKFQWEVPLFLEIFDFPYETE